MVITSKLRRHKVMERAMRALMGNNLPPRFKFKDTYDSIEVPTAYQQHLPSQATLEAKFDELIAEEETEAPTTEIKADMTVSSNLEVGTSNLFVDTETGNVGIGTAGPGALLEISSATGSSTITPTKMRISSTTDASDWNITDDWGTVSFYATDGSGAGPGDVAAIGARAVGAVGGTAALTFRTKAGDAFPLAEHMCILDDGNVGIGTTDPLGNLHVRGENVYLQSALVSNCTWRIMPQTGNTTKQFRIYDQDNATDRLVIDASGNVGIGTNNPGGNLEVAYKSASSLADGTIRIGNYSTTSTYGDNIYSLRWSSQLGMGPYSTAKGIWSRQGIALHVDANEEYSVKSSGWSNLFGVKGGSGDVYVRGNVGIGTASPIEKAHIYVDDASSDAQLFIENASASNRTGLVLKNANGEGFNIQHTVGASNAAIIENFSTVNGGIHFYAKGDGDYRFRTTDSNTTRFLIANDGNVAVGAITPQSKLHVDGDVRMKSLSTSAIGKITPVYARGTGNNNSANRRVKIGDTTHVNTGGRGLTLTIITASTHAHVSSTNYDTYGSTTASNNLATALEAMTDAQIGILTSHDAYEDNISANLITAALKLGLTRLAASADDMNRHPYAAIFYGPGASGVPGNHALEVMKSDNASGAYATLSTFLIDDSFIGQTLTNALYSGTADATTPTVIVDKNENVGIGTVSPTAPLHTLGEGGSSDNSATDLSTSVSRAKLRFQNRSGSSLSQYHGTTNSGFSWYQQIANGAGTTSYDMVFNPFGGNVGIGTVSPYSNFHVYTAGGGPNSTDCLVIGDPLGSAAVNLRIGAATNYSWIQSHEGSDLRLNPVGNTITYGSGNTTLSDDRIKDNEEYIRDATQTLLKLKPQIYDKHLIWDLSSEDASNVNTVRESGLITQDVWYDTPELRHLVHLGREAHPSETKPYTDDDPQNDPDYSTWGNNPSTLNYTGLIPYLIKSNQELYTDLQAEKARNDALEARIAALENL